MDTKTSAATENFLARLLPLLAVGIILAHVALAWWSFTAGDLLKYAVAAKGQPLIPSALAMYAHWSGRVSVYVIDHVILRLGFFPEASNWLVTGGMLLFCAAMLLVIARVGGYAARGVALFDLAFFLLALPNNIKQQALYWLDTQVIYVLPLSLAGFVLLAMGKHVRNARALQLALLLFFIFIGAFNEALALMLVIGIAGYLLMPWRERNATIDRRLLMVAIGALIGFLIDAAAPGNYERLQSATTVKLAALPLLINSLQHMAAPLAFFLAMFCYGIVKAYVVRPAAPPLIKNGRTAAWLAALVAAAYFPAVLMITYLDDGRFNGARTMLAPYATMFLASLPITYWLMQAHYWPAPTAAKRAAIALALAITLFMPAPGWDGLVASLKQAPEQRRIALQQFALAKAAKPGTSLTVPVVPNKDSLLFFEPLAANEDFYINRLFAEYYGLKEVRTR